MFLITNPFLCEKVRLVINSLQLRTASKVTAKESTEDQAVTESEAQGESDGVRFGLVLGISI